MLSVSILTSFVLTSFGGGSREPGDKLAAFSLLGIDFDGAALDLTRIRSNVKRAAPRSPMDNAFHRTALVAFECRHLDSR
ncbi:hypothetical protein GGP85_002670 [Salinibacter ruber]|jgi:hypothetical protein|uniref:Uncharacterized protein n=1 Tax=Salinibacter ruber TaxID=146919 RepID=A0A9X2ZU98_9BACT|nr:hypothetical protein [Salinibacter ruber]MCS3669214.1 hypothetical protein [Salinibacter ruber]MCS3827202.1 hypothetical protein [Salinibacter ruber]MCS3940571.1 hypothetical protein [Salinibacter ruber]MCS3953407.1 hypothetical protein [Salinibacter ruber]